MHYTNAPTIIREDFRDTEDLGGVFSGWDAEKKQVRSRDRGSTKARAAKQATQPDIIRRTSGGHGKDRGGEAGKTSTARDAIRRCSIRAASSRF